ncbi:ABC transporter substrate-binding protein [Aminobacter aminovorans]|uniref:ABC transporter substrate-binding protein n=1 Tax=Aminobacter TaxID=31988 RepID=UPI00286549B8|nr:ABC transporter substrate-binding protein [Aminobacter aminovorans]MDR7224005.1 NitT/TauT family transport system substrate-binding protein [Aminobacter aminovorans]
MSKGTRLINRIAVGIIGLNAMFSSGQSFAADEVNIRFSYKLKGEYGFFYLGQEKGVYSQAGLSTSFGEGASSQAALGSLLQGQDDLAVLPGIFAISAIQKGMPIKIVALYQPAAPTVLVSHPDRPLNSPKDLEGKTIAAPVGETGTTYLGVFCEINNVDCSKIKKVQIDVQARVSQFLSNQIDVIAAYKTNDLPILEAKTGTSYSVLDQVKYGLIVPGMAVVASDDGISKKSDLLKKFLSSTATAIKDTRTDPHAAVAALKAVWPNGPADEVVLKQIDETSASIPASGENPVGWVDEKSIVDALKLLDEGSPAAQKPLSAFYTNALLQK